MGGIFLLIAFLVCGVAVCDALFRNRSVIERTWLGCAAGLIMMMCFPAGIAFAAGFTSAAQWCALGLAAALALLFQWLGRREKRCSDILPDGMPVWLLPALVLPLAALSGYLQYTHTLRPVDGNLCVGQSTYGDLCLHLGIATSLRGASFPPDYSILKGTLLGYPFLADSMVTSMLLFGGDLANSFIVTGTLMMLLVYTGYVLFAWELTHRPAAVVIAYLLMFINGGLGFLYTFDGVMKDPTALKQVFTGFYQTPTNMPDLNLRWVNVICDMMVPQRTLLAGWAVLIPALYQLVLCLRDARPGRFAVLGVWAGLMPMIHTHSFVALALISAGALLYCLWRSCRPAKPDSPTDPRAAVFLLLYGIISAVIALPQLMLWTFPQTVGGGSLNIRFNWVNNLGNGHLIDEYFWFWIKNVGIAYILIVPAVLSAPKGSRLRILALGALLIYAIAEIIQFQPNEYDNNKLFYVAYMAVLPCVGLYLVTLWQKLAGIPGRTLLSVLTGIACLLSGSLSLAREVVSHYDLFGAEEVEAARYIEENTPRHAMFLTGQQHNNAVAALTGRYILCGTGSYLYFHGIDYSAQREDARLLLEEPAEHTELFDSREIDYVYISSHERFDFAVDEVWFRDHCAVLFENSEVTVYSVGDDL